MSKKWKTGEEPGRLAVVTAAVPEAEAHADPGVPAENAATGNRRTGGGALRGQAVLVALGDLDSPKTAPAVGSGAAVRQIPLR